MKKKFGFTIIELIITIAITSIIMMVAVPKFMDLLKRSISSRNLGMLSSLRTALSLYYTENEGVYPCDDLTSIAHNSKYIDEIPVLHVAWDHERNNTVENNDLHGTAAIFTVDSTLNG